VHEDLTNAAGKAHLDGAFRLRGDGTVVDDREGWRSFWGSADELAKQADVEDVVETGTCWQVEADGDVIDELGDAVRAVEAGLELPLGDLWQRGGGAVAEAEHHPVTHCIGHRAVRLVILLLLDSLRLLEPVADIGQELIPVRHVLGDGGHTSFAGLIRADRWRVTAVDDVEWSVPE
jgi:hypothetical protein